MTLLHLRLNLIYCSLFILLVFVLIFVFLVSVLFCLYFVWSVFFCLVFAYSPDVLHCLLIHIHVTCTQRTVISAHRLQFHLCYHLTQPPTVSHEKIWEQSDDVTKTARMKNVFLMWLSGSNSTEEDRKWNAVFVSPSALWSDDDNLSPLLSTAAFHRTQKCHSCFACGRKMLMKLLIEVKTGGMAFEMNPLVSVKVSGACEHKACRWQATSLACTELCRVRKLLLHPGLS